jgi:hypothetical protein
MESALASGFATAELHHERGHDRVAATGSQLGVLELAAEEEMNPTSTKRKPKAKVARKKTKVAPKSKRKTKKRQKR